MQQYHGDASDYITSVDSTYILIGHGSQQVAQEAHAAGTRGDMELHIGDRIGVIRMKQDLHNGYGKGRNIRSSRIGNYPLYKVEEVVSVVRMPTYPEADWDNNSRDSVDSLEQIL